MLFPGFPDESLKNPIAFGEKLNRMSPLFGWGKHLNELLNSGAAGLGFLSFFWKLRKEKKILLILPKFKALNKNPIHFKFAGYLT